MPLGPPRPLVLFADRGRPPGYLIAPDGTIRPTGAWCGVPSVPPAGQVAPAPALPEGASCPPCASLPSAESADALVRGQPGALLLVVRDWAGRAALIALGMALGGVSPVLVPALWGATGIEVFVLLYRASKNAQAAAPARPPPPPPPA